MGIPQLRGLPLGQRDAWETKRSPVHVWIDVSTAWTLCVFAQHWDAQGGEGGRELAFIKRLTCASLLRYYLTLITVLWGPCWHSIFWWKHWAKRLQVTCPRSHSRLVAVPQGPVLMACLLPCPVYTFLRDPPKWEMGWGICHGYHSKEFIYSPIFHSFIH